MRVVSNTSPIWNLASIQRLDLLHDQFSEIMIPSEVLAELQLESGCPETLRIQHALDVQWIQIDNLKTTHLKRSLMLEYEPESRAILDRSLKAFSENPGLSRCEETVIIFFQCPFCGHWFS